jgi:hypothetical protein
MVLANPIYNNYQIRALCMSHVEHVVSHAHVIPTHDDIHTFAITFTHTGSEVAGREATQHGGG